MGKLKMAEEEYQDLIKNIAEALIKRKVVFLCGAGMSVESNIPGFQGIIKKLFYEYFGEEINKEEIERLSSKFRPEAIVAWFIGSRPGALQKLVELLNKLLEPLRAEPHAGHHLLNRFFSEKYISRIYTTNFESLIEKGFGEAGKRVTDNNYSELADIEQDGFIAVIHLHGHLLEGFKITEKHTFETDTVCLNEFFAEFSRSDYIIFIGHSFNDDDIRQLVLRFITQKNIQRLGEETTVYPQITPKKAFLVAVGPTKNDKEKIVAKGVWASRGFNFIPMSASEFIQNLNKEVQVVKRKDIFNKLPEKMGISQDMIQGVSARLENTFTNFNQDEGILYLARTFLGEII